MPRRKKRGGSCTRVRGPTWGIRHTRRYPAHNRHYAISQKKLNGNDALGALIDPGCETRSLIRQRPAHDKTRPQGPKAGGFWRMRRQWRKVLWLAGSILKHL